MPNKRKSTKEIDIFALICYNYFITHYGEQMPQQHVFETEFEARSWAERFIEGTDVTGRCVNAIYFSMNPHGWVVDFSTEY